ncbi:unnamed protein product [Caenorhabditis bovis]|uniref:DUF7774 domain-containing protein n=1 Tax=Caenorhabditis bovis TaxID=2654633 RepID=A0A8S1EXW3_9PELO|nr:unnamed protein product [Caenorhabditis bovis]
MGKSKTKSASRSIGKWKLIPNQRSKSESKGLKSIEDEQKNKKRREKSEDKSKDEAEAKQKKEKEAKKNNEFEQHSVFEEVEGPAQPCQTQTHGVKNKMRWKIDVQPVDVNGDPKIPDIIEKIRILKKKGKHAKKEITSRSRESTDDDAFEDDIILCGRIMAMMRIGKLIEKEISESDQEILKNYCRCGGDEDKATPIIEKIVEKTLASVVAKNENCRTPTVPGELRMFAVEESKAKIPLTAVLHVRKDLLYVSWSKAAEIESETTDATWAMMTTKKKKEGDKESKEETK